MAEQLDKCPMCGGKVHQFEDKKWGCEDCLRTWNDEGSGEYTSDVRIITKSEFQKLIAEAGTMLPKNAINVLNGWKNYIEVRPPIGVEVLAYSPAWIDDDFNPKGARVGFLNDGDGTFYSAFWWDYQDTYVNKEEDPLFWKHIE